MDDPARLTHEVWPWLPTFRAIAETEHLPSAAERMHLSTSAVSRTLRVLEERLGQPLFNRVGRRLVLNTAGARLLASVREGMREVEATLQAAGEDPFAGQLQVSAIGMVSNALVVPALVELRADHPALVPVVANHRTVEANALLAEGRLQVAFYYEALDAPALAIEHLGGTTSSVFCGFGHPLFGRRDVTRAEVLARAFSVPMIGDSGRVMDGWPVGVPRRIGMQITLLRSNLAVALSGGMLTVLPDATALPYWAAGQLWRLPFDDLDGIEVYAARDRRSPARGAGAALIERVRGRLTQVNLDVAALRDD